MQSRISSWDCVLAGEVGVARIGHALALGPVADRPRSMLMKAVTKSRWLPNTTASLMNWKNLILFSMKFGANIDSSLSLPTSLARSMINRWPSSSKKPASPVMK